MLAPWHDPARGAGRLAIALTVCALIGSAIAVLPRAAAQSAPAAEDTPKTDSAPPAGTAGREAPSAPRDDPPGTDAPPDDSANDSADAGSDAAPPEDAAAGDPPGPAAAAPVRVTLVRPTMTPEQRADWAGRLRAIYAQPSSRWPPPLVERSVAWREIEPLPEPAAAPPTPRAELGKLLFFDPRLSGSGQMACASCHDPDLNWADGRTVAIGKNRKPLTRNAPSLLNVSLARHHFWDGRAASLEEQARQVLSNPDEMDAPEALIVERLSASAGYRAWFQKAYGDETVNLDRVVGAIADFERTLVGGRSAFDKFARGQADALSDEAVIGLHLFRTEAHCMNCHHGASFSDDQFHDVGLSYYGRKYEDLGRYRITGQAADVGRFKTPTLRNVARTGPYMHNGLFPLDGVLNMYNAGMPTLRRKPHQLDDPLFPTKSPLLHPLYMNRQDLAALKAFLESLSEPPRRIRPPDLPE